MSTFQLNAEVNGDVVRCTGSVWRHTGWWWWWPQKQGVAVASGSMSFSGFLPSVEGYFVYSVKNF